uniref:Heat shock 70 kDa protein 12A-like n=1 Tax=Saccoglossus kowalevskii TaxID=10224 RepID=A0ABM0MDJ1_SACKO|nr:PREDICTED: heat shock 70 kDa protein 12A-like [Saccoglossus kowalevskii]
MASMSALTLKEQRYLAVVSINFGTTYSGFAFAFNHEHKGAVRNIHFCRPWTSEVGVIDTEVELTAANGHSMKAVEVFSHAIHYLKMKALKVITETTGLDFKDEEVQWVLTVPAIWGQASKQFMREAAYQANVASRDCDEQLIIALESEAASLHCIESPMAGFVNEETVDKKLVEIHKAIVGPFGGAHVDKEFGKLLKQIFGDKFILDYKKEYPPDWLRIIMEFEMKKTLDRISKVNKKIWFGKTIKYTFQPIHGDHSESNFEFLFYVTETNDALYIDDDHVRKGETKIVVESPHVSMGKNRDIDLKIEFADTEIRATAIDTVSGEVTMTHLELEAR